MSPASEETVPECCMYTWMCVCNYNLKYILSNFRKGYFMPSYSVWRIKDLCYAYHMFIYIYNTYFAPYMHESLSQSYTTHTLHLHIPFLSWELHPLQSCRSSWWYSGGQGDSESGPRSWPNSSLSLSDPWGLSPSGLHVIHHLSCGRAQQHHRPLDMDIGHNI